MVGRGTVYEMKSKLKLNWRRKSYLCEAMNSMLSQKRQDVYTKTTENVLCKKKQVWRSFYISGRIRTTAKKFPDRYALASSHVISSLIGFGLRGRLVCVPSVHM